MIYTFTPNLAVDLFIETDQLKANLVNRTNYFTASANGKGVNVSLILDLLGHESVITGYKAGFTGQYIEDDLRKRGFKTYLPQVDGLTRINVFTKVVEEGNQYDLVNPGPMIDDKAKNDYLDYLTTNIREEDIFTINGSFPSGIDKDYVEKICKIVNDKKAKLIIDNSSDYILNLCSYRPFLLKPNEHELCHWFDEKVKDLNQFIRLSKKLVEFGAQNIIVSLGSQGALFVNQNETLHVTAPRGQVINTAMAGDTLLATFIGQYLDNKSVEDAMVKSVSAGSSTAFSHGLTDFKDIDLLMDQVKVNNLSKL